MELGILNLKKLLIEGILELGRITHEDSIESEIVPLEMNVSCEGIETSENGLISGQGTEENNYGIRRAIYKDQIIEGETKKDKLNSIVWRRGIFDDGEYHIGWYKGTDRHGYGKTVLSDGTTEEGLFEEGEFKPNGNVSYDKTAKYAQKFNEKDYVLN